MPKRILVLQGGGIRGLVPALILEELECLTGRPACELFDLIVGTSTGGVIALGVAIPKPNSSETRWASDLVDLYSKKGANIFRRIETEHGIVGADRTISKAGLAETLIGFLVCMALVPNALSVQVSKSVIFRNSVLRSLSVVLGTQVGEGCVDISNVLGEMAVQTTMRYLIPNMGRLFKFPKLALASRCSGFLAGAIVAGVDEKFWQDNLKQSSFDFSWQKFWNYLLATASSQVVSMCVECCLGALFDANSLEVRPVHCIGMFLACAGAAYATHVINLATYLLHTTYSRKGIDQELQNQFGEALVNNTTAGLTSVKVAVTTVDITDDVPVPALFISDPGEMKSENIHTNVKAWEAAAATSAAPSYFAPKEIDIGTKKRQFIDGGVLNNFPVGIALSLAQQYWKNEPVALLSISTGYVKKGRTRWNQGAMFFALELLGLQMGYQADQLLIDSSGRNGRHTHLLNVELPRDVDLADVHPESIQELTTATRTWISKNSTTLEGIASQLTEGKPHRSPRVRPSVKEPQPNWRWRVDFSAGVLVGVGLYAALVALEYALKSKTTSVKPGSK